MDRLIYYSMLARGKAGFYNNLTPGVGLSFTLGRAVHFAVETLPGYFI